MNGRWGSRSAVSMISPRSFSAAAKLRSLLTSEICRRSARALAVQTRRRTPLPFDQAPHLSHHLLMRDVRLSRVERILHFLAEPLVVGFRVFLGFELGDDRIELSHAPHVAPQA